MPDAATDLDVLVQGVMGGERQALARAITLVESRHGSHARLGQELLERLLPLTGDGIRIGVSGVPGSGKSTLIDALGMLLLDRGYRVAVLAVDPSSAVSGGSILGDKSRMTRLVADERAFIRPSPAAQTPGGVARRTQEALLLCEAAGYDIVFVETVGVGQSELEVADMVDTFLVLLLPSGGDELQGIKKGILELADIILVNKADGSLAEAARHTRADYAAAQRYLTASESDWPTEVLALSARTGDGLEALWSLVEKHRRYLEASGELEAKRRGQRVRWFRRLLEEEVMRLFRTDERIEARLPELEERVRRGTTGVTQAVDLLLAAFRDEPN